MRHPASLHRRATRLLIVLLTVLPLALSSCGKDEEETPNQPQQPTTAAGFVSGVSVGGTTGAYNGEPLPIGSAARPAVVGASQIVEGGSIVLEVTVEDTADQLFVGVAGVESGHYAISLGAGTAPARAIAEQKGIQVTRAPRTAAGAAAETYNIAITSARSGVDNFVLMVGADHGGTASETTSHPIQVNDVAQLSDKLQVSLNWTQPVDLDLHLEVPDGSAIFFANTTAGGGTLDLDSNPACNIDNVNNENITWQDTEPAAGVYKVHVNLWSACDQPGPFPYAVTVNVRGNVQVFEGTISAAAEDPGGTGILVHQFTVSGGA